VLRNKYNIAGL